MDPQPHSASPALPSLTGLHIFAKRNGLWDSTVEKLAGGQEAAHAAAKSLLLAYNQKSMGLADAAAAIEGIPAVILEHYAQGLAKFPASSATKTAASYPQAITEKGGDVGKALKGLEKAVGDLNEALVATLKFDPRISKLERDTYALFTEYLAANQQIELAAAQAKAQEPASVTGSLSTPPTDERSGEHDDGDIENGDSITAAVPALPSDDEILTAARTKSLNQAREDYVNGRMSQDLFDAFVPLWEALHHPNGPAELQGALYRGDITPHLFDLGQRLLSTKPAPQ